MVFSSPSFIFLFLPLFFASYYLITPRARNAVILVDSILFYFTGAGHVAMVLILSESWPRKSAQNDRWSFCLTAGTLWPANQERPWQRRPRRNHTPAFKSKVALAAIKGDRTLAQLAEQFDVHPNQITSWKALLEEGASDVCGPGGGNGAAQLTVDVKSLHAKIGELTLESDFLEGALGKEVC
jgi:transposase